MIGTIWKFNLKVVKKNKKRVKHVPQRTCIGCRKTADKKTLMRIVKTPEGIKYDPTGKAQGRGAYVHNNRVCWEQALKMSLSRALKAEITPDDHEELQRVIATLPEEES